MYSSNTINTGPAPGHANRWQLAWACAWAGRRPSAVD